MINYIHFDTIDSTNTWVKTHAATLDPKQLTCVTALEQTAGRGRFKRQWISPKGMNIYATLYFTLPRNFPYLANLGQILSLSCAKVLKKQGFSPELKWPNDILLEGKKLAGILCEVVPIDENLGIVLGIGLNLNMPTEWLEKIDQPATSLAQLSGQTWTVEQILDPLIHQFLKDLSILQSKGFEPFSELYNELLAFKGQIVTCNSGVEIVEGICHSIGKDGKLHLLLPNGELVPLSAGEIHLNL
ncbi:MAG: biotin--[acetyl-CoA-carboxylase] ligase [Verrucomicrobia bacterium]|nr:biotin--[acetyl-CoA-carboxylase] ligase [Verrucomicrobiota bacterium]